MTKRILAIGAHPDDIEFGCGGILAKEAKKGSNIKHLVLSLGEAGTSGTPEGRKLEATNAAKIIGSEIEFFDFGGDCHITYSTDRIMGLAKKIREFKPNVVLSPTFTENQHPDHSHTGKMVRDAARFARLGNLIELKHLPPHRVDALYYFAITQESVHPAELFVDVSDVVDVWRKAIESHESQMKTREYADLILSKAQWLGLSIGAKYAMRLYANDPIVLDHISDIERSARNF